MIEAVINAACGAGEIEEEKGKRKKGVDGMKSSNPSSSNTSPSKTSSVMKKTFAINKKRKRRKKKDVADAQQSHVEHDIKSDHFKQQEDAFSHNNNNHTSSNETTPILCSLNNNEDQKDDNELIRTSEEVKKQQKDKDENDQFKNSKFAVVVGDDDVDVNTKASNLSKICDVEFSCNGDSLPLKDHEITGEGRLNNSGGKEKKRVLTRSLACCFSANSSTSINNISFVRPKSCGDDCQSMSKHGSISNIGEQCQNEGSKTDNGKKIQRKGKNKKGKKALASTQSPPPPSSTQQQGGGGGSLGRFLGRYGPSWKSATTSVSQQSTSSSNNDIQKKKDQVEMSKVDESSFLKPNSDENVTDEGSGTVLNPQSTEDHLSQTLKGQKGSWGHKSNKKKHRKKKNHNKKHNKDGVENASEELSLKKISEDSGIVDTLSRLQIEIDSQPTSHDDVTKSTDSPTNQTTSMISNEGGPMIPDKVIPKTGVNHHYSSSGTVLSKQLMMNNNAVVSSCINNKYLLPPLPVPSSKNQACDKKCIVVDLDETLVHSSFKPIRNADYIVPVEIDGKTHQVFVLKRPYVDHFLYKIGQVYECVLFTASLSKYADPVTDLLDKWNVFGCRLFRESCVLHRGNYVKDLSRIGRPLERIIIVDNSPASYIFHPENAIPVTSWFDDPNDRELADLLPPLQTLAHPTMQSVYKFIHNIKLNEYNQPNAMGQQQNVLNSISPSTLPKNGSSTPIPIIHQNSTDITKKTSSSVKSSSKNKKKHAQSS